MPVFLAPWFLAAGAVALIPVALHLLHRRKPRPVPFSSLRFLRAAVAKTRRSRHVTNLVTLLLRMLLLLLLATAFARPKLRSAAWLPEGRRTAVLVLDASASMQTRTGETTCFDQAKIWARRLIESLDDADQVALLLPGLPEPQLVFPPISDHEALLRALERVTPGHDSIDLVRSLADVIERLPTDRDSVGTEIHVFSDFQRSNWDAAAAETLNQELRGHDIRLFLNHVRPAVAANAAIQRAVFHPPAILGDGSFQAKAHVLAAPDFDGGNTLRLLINEVEQNRVAIRLRPEQALEETLSGKAAGDQPFVAGQLEIDPDCFAADNVFRFSLPRLPGIPVLMADGSARGTEGARDTFFLRNAIQPQGDIRTLFLPAVVDWQTFLAGAAEQVPFVCVCNPPSFGDSAVAKLEEFARNGGAVLLTPGQNGVLEERLTALEPLRGAQFERLELAQDTALNLVASQAMSPLEKRLLTIMPPPTGLVVRRRLVARNLPANAKPVFLYPDGSPFLVQIPFGQGAFWIGTLSVNRDWSDWPLSPFFVVLHQELIKNSVRRNLAGLMTYVGKGLALDWPETVTEMDVEIESPSGRRRTVSLSRSAGDRPFLLQDFHEPGFWRLRRGSRERVIAVNIPDTETVLVYVPELEIETAFKGTKVVQTRSWQGLQRDLADLHQGRPVWPWILCLALIVAVGEELFANVRSRASALPEALRRLLRRGTTTP